MRKLLHAAAALALSCASTVAMADEILLSSDQVIGNTGVFNAANLFDEQTGVVSGLGSPATSRTNASLTLDLGSATDFGQIELFTAVGGSFVMRGAETVFWDPFSGYYLNGGEVLARGNLNADAGVSGVLSAQTFSIGSLNSYRYISIFFSGSADGEAATPGSLNEVRLFDGAPGAVPEPATWAMMILGFGACGVAMRRSRRRTALAAAA